MADQIVMRSLWGGLFCVLLFFAKTFPLQAESIQTRFLVYYGQKISSDHLKNVDIAILDPDSMDPRPLQNGRTRFYGYISVGEAEEYRFYWPIVSQKKMTLEPNPNWPGAHLVDIRSQEWQDILLNRVIPRILDKGYDGLFLDTIDVPIMLEETDPEKYADSVHSLVTFVRSLKQKYPQAGIIPNNGLAVLDQIAPLIDGIVVEDLYTRYDFRNKKSIQTPQKETSYKEIFLDRFLKEHSKPVLNILYEKSPNTKLALDGIHRSESRGYSWYLTTVDLMNWGTFLSEKSDTSMKRKILSLYDQRVYPDPFHSRIHQIAEMPLNHLGMEVVHRPIQDPYPTLDDMKEFRGILTWFDDKDAITEPVSYCNWLAQQMNEGRKVVILENPGFFIPEKENPPPACREMFRTMGVEYRGGYTKNPYFMEMVSKDPKMVEFERPLDLTEELQMSLYHLIDPKGRSYLQIRRQDMDEEKPSDLVWTTPAGGGAHASFVTYQNRELEKVHWRLNPFLFFEKAFGLEGLPRPDVTTRNGRRVFFSQVDGDGIFNISHIDQKTFSGEIILREIFEKMPSLPITASLITGYFDYTEYQSERVKKLYQAIFSLKNIEPASHGYAHPLIWQKGKLALNISGYDFSAEKEINGSVSLMNSLLESLRIPKQTSLFLWTGDGIPSADQLSLAAQNNQINLNGGGGRFDRLKNSYAYLFPIGIKKGENRQIYTALANENDFTNLWKGPYYGFEEVIETFKNTETPRRIKPINIYYHYYSGERLASLKALKKAYDYALSQEIFPLFASEYTMMAQDYFETQIETISPNGWRISHNGSLKTIRFDSNPLNVDMNQSKGVLGFRHIQGNLYVSLDNSPIHDIYLTSSKPKKPFLISASFEVADFSADSKKIFFKKKGWGTSEIVMGGLTPRRKYRVMSGAKGMGIEAFEAQSDSQGILKVPFAQIEGEGETSEVTMEVDSL